MKREGRREKRMRERRFIILKREEGERGEKEDEADEEEEGGEKEEEEEEEWWKNRRLHTNSQPTQLSLLVCLAMKAAGCVVPSLAFENVLIPFVNRMWVTIPKL